MGGFFGWFLTFLLVVAIFNAEKWPSIRSMLEDKIKDSVDAAKVGSKLASYKIKQVKTDLETKRTTAKNENEAEENTPEEIAESLQFMENYIKPEETEQKIADVSEDEVVAKTASKEEKTDVPEEEKPIDLEHRY